MNNINKVPPFKGWVIQNFPFIEADFDAITEYQLLCKVVEYLNKVIANENQLSESMNYVLNYFNNLDVQDEVDNKLDKMAESGELTEIIAQYLQLAGVLAYDTKAAMKGAENLASGSICKTLGNTSYSDGQGAFYRIRQVQNTDIIDDDNIIALAYPNLVAEKIPYSSGYDLNTQIGNLTTKINNIDSNVLTEMVVIGDSYTAFSESNWAELVAEQLNLNLHKHATSSMGFAHSIDDKVFSNLLDFTDTSFYNKVKYVICYGGINDYDQTRSDIQTGVTNFITKAKTNFPNAQIIIAGPQKDINISAANTQRYEREVIAIERACLSENVSFTNASEWLRRTEYLYTQTYSNDNLHPSALGYKIIASKMLEIINNNIEDITKLSIKLFEGQNGNCFYKNCEGYTHFNATITNANVVNGVYTTLLEISGFDNININTNLDGYLMSKEFFPVYKLNGNNASELIGAGRVGTSGDKYTINFVSWATTFTGDIAIAGDLYFSPERTN